MQKTRYFFKQNKQNYVFKNTMRIKKALQANRCNFHYETKRSLHPRNLVKTLLLSSFPPFKKMGLIFIYAFDGD